MTVTATPGFLQVIQTGDVQILPADTTTNKTIFTAGTNGSKILAIIVTSTDTSARDVQLKKTISGTDYILGTFNIPITAGTINSVPSVNLLNSSQLPNLPTDSNGNPYLQIKSGTTLTIACTTTVTTAKVISITTTAAADY